MEIFYSTKAGVSNKDKVLFVRMTKKEACATIISLAHQIMTGDPNESRDETFAQGKGELEGLIGFTIAVSLPPESRRG